MDTADNSGNPGLQPERAIGLNLSYTHGLGANSEVVAELYAREIEQKIGSEIALAEVAWASAPRYVARPVNLGQAKVMGLNLEARVAARDLWKSAPNLDLNASLSFSDSKLRDLPGPDNGLTGQTPWRAKLGASYTAKDWPLKLTFDANWLPPDWVRINVVERTFQSRRFTLNAGANWKVSSDLRLSLNLENLLSEDAVRIDEYVSAGDKLRRQSASDTHPRVALRLELKL